jgi:hypothetical protein
MEDLTLSESYYMKMVAKNEDTIPDILGHELTTPIVYFKS